MSEEDNKVNKPGVWQKGGPSPNKNGRTPGVKKKKMSQKQLAEYLGKRSEFYLKKIEEIAEKSEDLKLKFTCYNGLLNYDFQVRASEYKEWLDKENLKLKKQANKPQKSDDDEHQKQVAAPTQVLSLKLGGKQ